MKGGIASKRVLTRDINRRSAASVAAVEKLIYANIESLHRFPVQTHKGAARVDRIAIRRKVQFVLSDDRQPVSNWRC